MPYISDSPLDAARFAAGDTDSFKKLVDVANAASTDDDLLNRDEFADFVWNLTGVRIDRAESTRLIESYAGTGAYVVSKEVIIEGMTADGLLVPPNRSAGIWYWTLDKSAIGGDTTTASKFQPSGDVVADVAVIMGLSLADRVEVFNALPTIPAENLVNLMPNAAAIEVLTHMEPNKAREILYAPSPQRALTLLAEMPAIEAAKLLDGMGPNMFDVSSGRKQYLANMPAANASNILSFMHPSKAAEALREIADPAVAGHLMDGMAPSAAKEAFAFLSPAQSARLLANMPAGEAVIILNLMEPEKAAEILEVMDTGKAADIFINMADAGPEGADRAAQMLINMQSESIATILIAVNAAETEQLSASGRTLSGDNPAAAGPAVVGTAVLIALLGELFDFLGEENQPAAQDAGAPNLDEAARGIDNRNQVEDGLGLVMGALPGAAQAADIPEIAADAAAARVDSPAEVLALMGPPVYGQPDSPVLLGALYRTHNYDPVAMAHDVGGRDPQGVANFLSDLDGDVVGAFLNVSSAAHGSAIISLMDPVLAADALANMHLDREAALLRLLPIETLGPILAGMDPENAVELLLRMSPIVRATVIELLVQTDLPAARAIVGEMSMDEASNLVVDIDMPSGMALLPALPLAVQRAVRADFNAQKMRAFLRDSPPGLVAQIIAVMDDKQIDLLMAGLKPHDASEFLLNLSDATARLIFGRMDPVDRAAIIGAMTPIEAARMIEYAMSPHVAAQTAEGLGAAAMAPIYVEMTEVYQAGHLVMLGRRAVGHDILALPATERAEALLAIDTPEVAAAAEAGTDPAAIALAAEAAAAFETAAAAATAATNTEIGEILLALDPVDASDLLLSLSAAKRADVLSTMLPADAADFLTALGTVEAAQIIEHMGAPAAAAIFKQMPVKRQLELLDRLPPANIVAVLPLLPVETGAAFFEPRRVNIANFQEMRSDAFSRMPAASVGPIISIMGPTVTSAILAGHRAHLDTPQVLERYSSILAHMTPETAAVELGNLGVSDSARVLDLMSDDRARSILAQLDPQRANEIIGLIDNRYILPFAVPAVAPDANGPAHDEL